MMPVAQDAVLDPRLPGADRLLALLGTALVEAFEPIAGASGLRLAACIALPALRPGFSEHDLRSVAGAARRLEPLATHAVSPQTVALGHAGGAFALAWAVQQLAAGKADICLVAGVDSYCHPHAMEWLDTQRRLLGAASRSGFVPGEAAACLLLGTQRAVHAAGAAPLLRLRDVAVGIEPCAIGSGRPCFGVGLSAVVRQAVHSLARGEGRIGSTICDLNGERYRSEEWGFTCLRAGDCFDDPTAYLAPATGWGDVGAASLPLFAALAWQARARAREAPASPLTLVIAGSDGGERGAALFEALH
jgi:3-oxoacyl-[acyl-carrier-protein] synthase-1